MYVLFLVIFRYSAVRRQFGPPAKDEIPVLEYQMQVCFSLDMLSIIYTKKLPLQCYSHYAVHLVCYENHVPRDTILVAQEMRRDW